MSLWDEAEKRVTPDDSTPDQDIDLEDRIDADDDDDLDLDLEDEEEGEEEDVEEEQAKTDVADDTGLTPKQQKAVQDEVLKYVDGSTILKVKGVEKKASDLSPKEMVVFLQKGMNADRLFQENAAAKRELDRQRAIVEQSAAALQNQAGQHGAGQPGGLSGVDKGTGLVTTLPEYLKPSPDDTPDIQQWKESQVRMLDEFNAMKRYVLASSQRETDQKKVNEVLALRETYPMASVDEVLAVKSVRPDIDSEELMRASHTYYSGADFLKKALDSNPTYKREYDAAVIKSYLAKRGSAAKIPGKKARGSGVERVSAGKARGNSARTFEMADSLSRDYIKEFNRIQREG
jgi:hypothetical protein